MFTPEHLNDDAEKLVDGGHGLAFKDRQKTSSDVRAAPLSIDIGLRLVLALQTYTDLMGIPDFLLRDS